MHTESFYKSRYNKYKKKIKGLGLTPKYDYWQFSDIWDSLAAEGNKRVFDQIIYSERYSTGYKTALAELRISRLANKPMTLEQLKSMSTHDFADMFRDAIDQTYNEWKDRAGSKVAKMMVSQVYFGSK